MARRLLIIFGAMLVLLGALYFFRYEVGWQFAFLLNPGGSFDEDGAGPAPDYSSEEAWILYGGDATAGAPGAVFYIHPTTLLKSESWNQPIAAARDDAFLDMLAPQQINVFDGLPVYAPYYRHAAFYAFIEKSDDAGAALALASRDVLKAFRTFVEAHPGGPIVIAGHSQGAYHALSLLTSIRDDEALLSRIAAVYAVGYPFPARYLETASPLPACEPNGRRACVASFNARGAGAYIPPFFEKTPLPGGDARDNGAIACWNPSTAESIVSARCDEEGWLAIERPPEEYREFLMSREWYHTVEFDLFKTELRADALKRIESARE